MLKLEERIRYLEKMNGNIGTSVIAVTGMHRSGTSLVASLLQSAGINIGQRLMNAGEGNVKGHFEDLDLVEFHESILKSPGFSNTRITTFKMIIRLFVFSRSSYGCDFKIKTTFVFLKVV